ncbi:MAG TPA: endonuclease/exonuclease/phosphatase family protein [Acetobacteraceae bacterium]|nr:endonuclease/exonuclease/phosphatase family protein [Acetobacteraceae bacterium]
MLRLFALVLCCLFVTLDARAAELKFATWNLAWLTERPAGDPALPPDVHPRHAEDFDLLRQYALRLNADVVALQEVDGRAVAQRVFPPDRYSLHLTQDRRVQRVGIAVRRGLRYDVNPDVAATEGDPDLRLRSEADITLHLPNGDLRILAVHLKTGCAKQRLARSRNLSCADLQAQMRPIAAWIAARRQQGEAFLLMGDFNRWMDSRDQVWRELNRAAPLARATEGRSSPCWGREAFIDHIIAGGSARRWMQRETLRVLVYRETAPDFKARLSDHCPVSVRLRVAE